MSEGIAGMDLADGAGRGHGGADVGAVVGDDVDFHGGGGLRGGGCFVVVAVAREAHAGEGGPAAVVLHVAVHRNEGLVFWVELRAEGGGAVHPVPRFRERGLSHRRRVRAGGPGADGVRVLRMTATGTNLGSMAWNFSGISLPWRGKTAQFGFHGVENRRIRLPWRGTFWGTTTLQAGGVGAKKTPAGEAGGGEGAFSRRRP